MRGGGWFFLFFWPSFRRIFLLDKKLEIWPQWATPCPPRAALSSRKTTDNVPACAVPQIVIETQIEHWIRWTLESNIALAAALKRLRDSYKLLEVGKIEKDADEILAQVEAVLKTVEKGSI
jgi:hypothetical protein